MQNHSEGMPKSAHQEQRIASLVRWLAPRLSEEETARLRAELKALLHSEAHEGKCWLTDTHSLYSAIGSARLPSQ